jgi:hypothetical protein
MALKKTVVTSQGFEAIDAYHRVENVNLVKKDKINFQVRSYKDPSFSAFEDTYFECEYSLFDANPIKQAYNHLKTLPEFADAIDC